MSIRLPQTSSIMATDAKSEQLMGLLRIHRKDPAAKRRLMVIRLSRKGILTAAQIAERLHIARSTVFAYRRLYLEKGPQGLLARTKRGRPATPITPAVEQVIVKGLRQLLWFNIPALMQWVHGHAGFYPAWTIRRWALALIKRRRIRFAQAWEGQRGPSYERWLRSADRSDNPLSRWRRVREQRESTEPSLGLAIVESPGLRPWFDLAA